MIYTEFLLIIFKDFFSVSRLPSFLGSFWYCGTWSFLLLVVDSLLSVELMSNVSFSEIAKGKNNKHCSAQL